MAGRYRGWGGVKAVNFLTLLLLCTLLLSIIVISSFLNKKGTSLDIREEAVYFTPTPSYFYSLKLTGCSIPSNAKPFTGCKGEVVWASSGLKNPSLWQKIEIALTYMTSDPSGKLYFNLRNVSPADCITFVLAGGTTAKVSKSVCIEYIPYCGLMPCP